MGTSFPSIQFNWNEGIVSYFERLIDLSKLDSITLSSQSLTDFPQGRSMFGLRIPPTQQQPRLPSYQLPSQVLVALQVYNEILPAVYLSCQPHWEEKLQGFLDFKVDISAVEQSHSTNFYFPGCWEGLEGSLLQVEGCDQALVFRGFVYSTHVWLS